MKKTSMSERDQDEYKWKR